jgi:hypothetical protein
VSEADASDKTLALSDVEKWALIALPRRTIDEARFPYSPRLGPAEGDIGEACPAASPRALAAAEVYAPPRAKPSQHRGRR